MTEPIEDRPASLPRRKPQPSPDERVDPVDPPAAVSAPPQQVSKPAGRGRKREIVTVLSTRLSQEVQDILDTAVDTNAITVRQAVEEAIRGYWGTKR